MMAAMRASALAVMIAALGCRGAIDAASLERRLGPDGAAEELRYRLAANAGDAALWSALATVEAGRGRSGAAIEAYQRAEALGAPFRAGLDDRDRAALAQLLLARADARVARGSSGADADVARARRLDATAPPTLARAAALIAIAGDLAHTDPARRDRGRARLATIDAARARAWAPDATDAEVASTAAWLDDAGARRSALALLDDRAERAAARGVAPAWDPATTARWLRLRRWWGGPGDAVELTALDRARAAGLDTCAWARGPRDPGCDVRAAAGSADGVAPAWEPALVAAWQRDGWRVREPDDAMAWMIVAGRAVARGELPSWAVAVRTHVDVEAVRAATALPAWATAALATLDDPAAAPPLPVTSVDAPEASPVPWSRRVAALAVGADGDAALADGLAAVVTAYARDPALADRRAEDLAGAAIDLAVVAPALGRTFTLQGDPARARAWWQRGVDASPEEPTLALGLALAMIRAGDGPAAQQQLVRAAAGSGDAATTLYRAARGFAAAGATLDALTACKLALEHAAPGDEAMVADLAASLLAQLGRERDAGALAALVRAPGSGDLAGSTAEVTRARRLPRAAALARLTALVGDPDPATAALAATALTDLARERSSP